MRLLRLHGGGVAGVDDADYETLAQHNWKLYAPSPSRTRATNYAVASMHGRKTYLHLFLWRHVWGRAPVPVVDHEDGDGLHCTRLNLRDATVAQNNRSRGALRNNTSGFKGVNWDKRTSRWRAKIAIDGTRLHLGYFDDPQDAANAYDLAALKHHGAFARTNQGAFDATPIRPVPVRARFSGDGTLGLEPDGDPVRAAVG